MFDSPGWQTAGPTRVGGQRHGGRQRLRDSAMMPVLAGHIEECRADGVWSDLPDGACHALDEATLSPAGERVGARTGETEIADRIVAARGQPVNAETDFAGRALHLP